MDCLPHTTGKSEEPYRCFQDVNVAAFGFAFPGQLIGGRRRSRGRDRGPTARTCAGGDRRPGPEECRPPALRLCWQQWAHFGVEPDGVAISPDGSFVILADERETGRV